MGWNPEEFTEMEEFEPWPGYYEWICENGMCEECPFLDECIVMGGGE